MFKYVFTVIIAVFLTIGMINIVVADEDFNEELEKIYEEALKEYQDKNSDFRNQAFIILNLRTTGIKNSQPIDIIPDNHPTKTGDRVTLFWVLFIPKKNTNFTLTWKHNGEIYRQKVYETQPTHRYLMSTWIILHKPGKWEAIGEIDGQKETLLKLEVK